MRIIREVKQIMTSGHRRVSGCGMKSENKHKKSRALAAACLLGAACSLAGCGEEKVENALAYRKIGINAMAEGDYQAAVDNFQKALDQSKGQIRNLELDICMQKAEALYLNGQTEDAIAVCDAVLEYDEDYANAYYLRGNLYLQQKDSQKALADYERAAKSAKMDYEVYIQLYENLNRAGMPQEGVKYLEEALALKGKDRCHLTNRGYIYYLMGNYEEAKGQLLLAVQEELAEGEDDKAELYLAQTAEKLGDEATAAKYYNAYAKDHADDSVVLEELGNIAMGKGDYANAYDYYKRGLEAQNPTNEKSLRKGVIAALEQQYEFERAKEEMAQYVLDYPDDAQAAREYEFLKTRTAAAEQPQDGQEEPQGEDTGAQ